MNQKLFLLRNLGLCIGNLHRMVTFWFSFSCNLFRSFSGGETIEVEIKKFHLYCIKWACLRFRIRMLIVGFTPTNFLFGQMNTRVWNLRAKPNEMSLRTLSTRAGSATWRLGHKWMWISRFGLIDFFYCGICVYWPETAIFFRIRLSTSGVMPR